jgi:hypothetical protein
MVRVSRPRRLSETWGGRRLGTCRPTGSLYQRESLHSFLGAKYIYPLRKDRTPAKEPFAWKSAIQRTGQEVWGLGVDGRTPCPLQDRPWKEISRERSEEKENYATRRTRLLQSELPMSPATASGNVV